jgi:hypothetical protein
VEIQDIEPVPRFTGLSTLGLGKTLELDAIGSFDPDQATGDGTGIIAYEWYVQRVDQPGSLEYLGNGVTLKYVYSDSSVLDKLGLYDITLKVTDNEGSMASLTKPLTLTMDFRNVVFHGWSPLPGETLLESHNTFAGYAGRLNELLRTPEFVPQGSTFASFAMNWDSFSGFSYALVSRLAAEAMLVPAPPQGRVAMLTLRQILLWAYRHQHALASRKAEAAAQDAAKFIAEDPGIIPDDPIRTPALHLIGHSRGGYVASRTSQILETNYGLESSYVTLLDGYGDDWPDFAASFADGNILSTATALNGNSFRVQQSLLEIASDPLADAVSKSIHDAANRFLSPSSWLSEVILEIHSLVDDAFRRWVASSEWRAPERAGIFGNNEIIPGSSVTGHSNHINIHELYFGSPATESREAIPASFELLLKSPVGNPAGSIPLSSSGASGEAVFDEPLDLAIDFLSPRFLAELYEIRQLASDNLSVLDGEESWIDVYLHLLATPGYLEEQFFGSADAQIVQLSSGQHGIKLAQASGIQTFVSASTGNGVVELSFVMENLLDGQSAEAQVTLDGNLVASIVIPENGLIKYSLPFSIGQSGIVNLGLEVAIPSSGGFDGKVSLTGVRILGSNPRGDFHASPPFNVIGQSEEIVLRLDDPVSTFGAAISSVVFFLETNNRHGLQDESSPDTVLGEGVREGNDWVLFITESDVHHGRNLVYAKITSEDMRRSIQSISFENFASKSNLTFYSNPFDVNRDGFVTPLDALLVVNHLSRNAGQEVVAVGALLPDVNGSGQVAPLDALMVLNEISRRSRVRPENEQVAEVTRHVPVLSHHEQTSGETLIELSRLDRSQRELTFDSRVLAGIVPDATLYGKNNQGLEPPANNEVLHFQEMRRAELEVLLQRRRGLDGAEVIALLPKDEHPSFLEWSLVDQLLSDIDFLLFDEESELHLSDGVARRA